MNILIDIYQSFYVVFIYPLAILHYSNHYIYRKENAFWKDVTSQKQF